MWREMGERGLDGRCSGWVWGVITVRWLAGQSPYGLALGERSLLLLDHCMLGIPPKKDFKIFALLVLHCLAFTTVVSCLKVIWQD